MRKKLRTDVVLDTRVAGEERDEEIAAWLGTNLLVWDDKGLVVGITGGTPVSVRPGWTLARHPEGRLVVLAEEVAQMFLEDDPSESA